MIPKNGKFPRKQIFQYGLFIVGILTILLAVILFLYLDRKNQLSEMIQSLGPAGVALALFLMALICLTPIPSEGLIVVILKVYGIYLGTALSWLGSILSSLVIFILARYYGQGLMRRLVTPARFDMVDSWVERKGTLGLFIARLLPIPAFIVNYIAGVIPSVRFWSYFWTGALSIIPYYVGTALVFMGVSKSTWIWLIIGALAIIAFWSLGFIFKRRQI